MEPSTSTKSPSPRAKLFQLSMAAVLLLSQMAISCEDKPEITVSPIPVGLIRGLGFSPFRDCQSPELAKFPSASELAEDMTLIARMGNAVRTYASRDTSPAVEHALKLGLRVSVGAWLGPESTEAGRVANRSEIEAAVAQANSLKVESVIVGNEVVLRNDLSPQQLAEYIREVKSRVKVPVTTAEIASVAMQPQNRVVIDAVDYFMAHIYPYWDGVSIDDAAWYVAGVFDDTKAKAGGKPVVIGETGWPSGGPSRGSAVPDIVNAGRFLSEWTAVAAQQKIDYYYFAAFDEPWKREEGVGPYWGMWNTTRQPKFTTTTLLTAADAPPPRRTVNSAVAPSASATAGPVKPTSPQDTLSLYQTWPASDLYIPSGWMGDTADITVDDCVASGRPGSPIRGAVDRAVHVSYTPKGANGWAGFYWQHPENNWGTIPTGGRDLRGYTALTFLVRGARGGEKLSFFTGGITGTHGDTMPATKINVVLTQSWQRYVIDVRGGDLSRVVGAFGWSAKGSDHPGGLVFDLDEIQFDRSLPTRPTPPPTTQPRKPCTSSPAGTPAGTLYVLDGALLCAKNSAVGRFDFGVDTSGQMRKWLSSAGGALKMSYPGGQAWGAVFLTVGLPRPPGLRAKQDLSHCQTLLIDMRSSTAGSVLSVGMKDVNDPDDGSETKVRVRPTSSWKTYSFPLSGFGTLQRSAVYIVTEFVFEATDPKQTVYFRNIRLRCSR